MTPSFPSQSPKVGRFTALILGFVVFVCVVMIGGTGYLKYQLDRAETMLAAPDAALGSDQETFDRLRRSLGYGGFLGLAQNYALAHDASGFAEMKADIKSADDIVAHLPDKTSAETRHDLIAIVSTFDASMQRLSASASEAPEFTASDLNPLYAALPILDARVSSATAETRLAAQNQAQYWAMLLTLVSWCSLIIAAACAAGIYLTLRDKHAAPMRALAQSIQNMARGDMRTAIWGVERQDMVGELARAVDIARYHFSHLPDISVLSEQGPVRMRFEGESRSLFEAMMKAISRDSETIREQSSSLTTTAQTQKQSISALSEKVEKVLHGILQNGQNGDQQIKQAIHDMAASAENLKNAHAHAADQLNRMLPYIQDRVHGMAEIAQITGKQVAQTLQSLTVTEMGLKANTEQAKEMLARLSSTADDLGERMFGAINLLQAGGKVLTETTEKINGKLLLESGEARSVDRMANSTTPVLSLETLAPLTQRLDEVASQIAALTTKLDDPHNHTVETVNTPTADIAYQLRSEQASIETALADIQNKLDTMAQATQEATQTRHSSPELQAEHLVPSIISGVEALVREQLEAHLIALRSGSENDKVESALTEIQNKLGTLSQTNQDIAHLQNRSAEQQAEQLVPSIVSGVEALVREQLEAQLVALRSDNEQNNIECALIEIQSKLDGLTQATQKADSLAPSIVSGVEILVREQLEAQLVALRSDSEQNNVESTLTEIQNKLDGLTQATQKDDGLAPSIVLGVEALLREQLEAQLVALRSDSEQNNVESTLTEIQNKIDGLTQATQGVETLAPSIVLGVEALVREQLKAQLAALRSDSEQNNVESALTEIQNKLGALAQTTQENSQLQYASTELQTKYFVPSIVSAIETLVHEQLTSHINALRANIEQNGITAMDAARNIKEAVSTKLQESFGLITEEINTNTRKVLDNDATTQSIIQSVTEILTEKIKSLSMTLPSDVQAATQSDLKLLSEQIDASQTHTAQNIERHKRDVITHSNALSAQSMETANAVLGALRDMSDKVATLEQALPPDMQQRMKDQWYQIASQIEASRSNVEKLFVENVAGKLASFETSVLRTQSTVEEAKFIIENPPKITYSLQAELQKQMADQWFQVAAQIESARTGLIEGVSHQIDMLEGRLTEATANKSLSKTVADYSSQRQFDQQTQILSELVTTLSMLDAHVQQIQTQINVIAH